jgi:serine protease Do
MNGPYGEFFRRFFQENPGEEMQLPSTGSGFIIDSAGHILTNSHVVRGATDIVVHVPGRKDYPGEIVGTDPRTDIAVIRIKPDGELPVVPLGDSDEIRVGDWAIAIGNPLGQLQGTVTVGVISAKGRSSLAIEGGTPDYQDFIQTDASINFGNSGGPLVNARGEAIGINTALNPSGQGLGFAIPINMAKTISAQLIASGHVVRAYLGIMPQELTPALAESWGIGAQKGVVVGSVQAGTPAESAGLRTKDLILEFDGTSVSDVARFRRLVAETEVNKKVRLRVLRAGEIQDIYVTLAERPDETAEVPEEKPDRSDWIGLEVAPVEGEIAEDLGLRAGDGVVITGVRSGSPAEEAGLSEGDVVREINDRAIDDVDEFEDVVERVSTSKRPIVFLVQRGDFTTFVAVRPPRP